MSSGVWSVWADYCEHCVPFGAAVVNYRACRLCTGEFLPDSSGSDICGRELCRAVKIAWAKELDAERERRGTPVLPNKAKSYHKKGRLLVLSAALTALTGCAVKKPVLQPLVGPVTAHYNLSDCKPMSNFQPGLDCKRVQLTPILLPAQK